VAWRGICPPTPMTTSSQSSTFQRQAGLSFVYLLINMINTDMPILHYICTMSYILVLCPVWYSAYSNCARSNIVSSYYPHPLLSSSGKCRVMSCAHVLDCSASYSNAIIQKHYCRLLWSCPWALGANMGWLGQVLWNRLLYASLYCFKASLRTLDWKLRLATCRRIHWNCDRKHATCRITERVKRNHRIQ